jgi:nicotinamide riboside kinase
MNCATDDARACPLASRTMKDRRSDLVGLLDGSARWEEAWRHQKS